MLENESINDYKATLSDLTFSSRPLIDALTMLAEENINLAPQIVDVIENRIQQAPKDQVLAALHLLDSIIKRITSSRVYLNIFAENIADIFASAFERVEEKVRMNLFSLRKTWCGLFQASVLRDLDMLTKSIDPAWPIFTDAPLSTGASLKEDKSVRADEPSERSSENITSDVASGPSLLDGDRNVDLPIVIEELKVAKKSDTGLSNKKNRIKKSEYVDSIKQLKMEQEKLLKLTSILPKVKGDLLGQILTSGAASGVLKLDEEEEASMRRQVIAKKQEMLSIEQQRLKLQVEKARRQVEMQKSRMKKQAAASAVVSNLVSSSRKKSSEISNIWEKLSDLTPTEIPTILVETTQEINPVNLTPEKKIKSTKRRNSNENKSVVPDSKKSFSEKLGIVKIPLNVSKKSKEPPSKVFEKPSNEISNNVNNLNKEKMNIEMKIDNSSSPLKIDKSICSDKQVEINFSNSDKKSSSVSKNQKYLEIQKTEKKYPKEKKNSLIESEDKTNQPVNKTKNNEKLIDVIKKIDNKDNIIDVVKDNKVNTITKNKSYKNIVIDKEISVKNTDKKFALVIDKDNKNTTTAKIDNTNIISLDVGKSETKKKKVPTATLR